jgi:hypothetical protein
MKSKNEKKQKSFEDEYIKIMKEFQSHNAPYFQHPQWANSGDFIIKFSLFQEMPNSITSTDTTVNL